MRKKELKWSLIAFAIAAISILAVVSQARHLSFDGFMDFLAHANPIWLIISVLCMVCYIAFEALGLCRILRAFGYRVRFRTGCLYAASDIYFSSITPSATGGQPASAFFMVGDGISAAVSTVALLLNLIMYTISIMIVGVFAILENPMRFMGFGMISKVLIVIGYIILGTFAVSFLLLLHKAGAMHSLCDGVLTFLEKFRLIRKPEKKRAKLKKVMDDYTACADMVSGQRKMLLQVFFFNFFQRVFQIAVPAFVFLATGGSLKGAADVWSIQSFVTIGSSCLPIPGAMGVSDYLLLDGLGGIVSPEFAIRLELVSRSISFYSCVLISAAMVLFGYIRRKNRVSAEDAD